MFTEVDSLNMNKQFILCSVLLFLITISAQEISLKAFKGKWKGLLLSGDLKPTNEEPSQTGSLLQPLSFNVSDVEGQNMIVISLSSDGEDVHSVVVQPGEHPLSLDISTKSLQMVSSELSDSPLGLTAQFRFEYLEEK